MEWYLKVVRDNYANFEGRARRKEYWMFVLVNILIIILLSILVNILGLTFGDSGIISTLYSLAVLIPTLAVGVRRLHDVGKSGWWLFIALIPVLGGLYLLYLYVTDGTAGDNLYGPNPKGVATPAAASTAPAAEAPVAETSNDTPPTA